jgi:hypothetical protein
VYFVYSVAPLFFPPQISQARTGPGRVHRFPFFATDAVLSAIEGEHRDLRELRKFTAEPAEFAEKIVFILNLSGLGVLCG